jgi:hypothetical protein
MRISSGVFCPWLLPNFQAIGAILTLAMAWPAAMRAAESDNPLAYVPAQAAMFAHLRVGDLWNSKLSMEIRKAGGKDFDKAIADAVKEFGIHPDAVETVTFFYPTMPMGPGDQQVFILIVTTNKPYDKTNLLSYVRKKDAKEKDGSLRCPTNCSSISRTKRPSRCFMNRTSRTSGKGRWGYRNPEC